MKKLFTLFLFVAAGIYTSQLSAQAPVPAGNFESGWSDTIACTPWNGIDISVVPIINLHTFTQTTDAHGGTYAAKIETKAAAGIGTIPGAGNMGTIDLISQTVSGGTPFTDKPTKLKGYIKYTPVAGDTCAMFLLLFQAGDTMAYGEYYSFTAIPSYTYFEIPLIYDLGMTGNPDTLNIIVLSSMGSANAGSNVKLDDLEFEYFVGVEENATLNVSVSPNPSAGMLTIQTGVNTESEITVMNALGQTVKSTKRNQSKVKLDISDQPDGMYFVQVRNGSQRIMKKIILTR
ncbi:MAG: T9SS type A sorting domain-containing protein [Bacteroidota bacterium]